jgi:hypothetical protein
MSNVTGLANAIDEAQIERTKPAIHAGGWKERKLEVMPIGRTFTQEYSR